MYTGLCGQHYSLLRLTTPRIHSLPGPGNHLPSKASRDLGPWFGTLVTAFACVLSSLAASHEIVNVQLLTVTVVSKTAPYSASLQVGMSRQARTYSGQHSHFHFPSPEKT